MIAPRHRMQQTWVAWRARFCPDDWRALRYVLCALTLAGALVLCMVQIWPIWMKIGLW